MITHWSILAKYTRHFGGGHNIIRINERLTEHDARVIAARWNADERFGTYVAIPATDYCA
jgi:hypothetical protein